MISTGRTIAKNASFMMVSQLVTWGLSLVSVIFIPRYLGAAGIGKYQLAASIWAIMAIFITFGMDTLLTKEISRDPDRISELLATSIFLRTVIFLASFVLVLVYSKVMDYPNESKAVIYIIGLSILIGQIGFAFRASLQGLESMEFISLGDIAAKFFLMALAIIFLLKGYGLLLFASLDVGAALVSLTILYFALRKIRRVQIRFNHLSIGWMLKASFPYLVLGAFMVAYSQIHIIIISLLVSEKQIGWYSAASRLTGTFLFIPTVFMAASFPASSRMHITSPKDLKRLMSKSFDLLLLVCFPIGLGLMILSNPLVNFLYGPDFTNSGPILAVMGIALVFISINMLIGQFFVSSDRQNVWTRVMAVATVITILLDIVFIPWCQAKFGIGALGGAVSFLVTEAGMIIYGLVMLPKGMVGWKNGWLALRVMIAGLAMAAVVWWLRSLFVAIPIGIGIIVYSVFLLLLRVISREDWEMIRDMGLNVFKRLGLYKEQPAIVSKPSDTGS